jgi:hypothetical protein
MDEPTTWGTTITAEFGEARSTFLRIEQYNTGSEWLMVISGHDNWDFLGQDFSWHELANPRPAEITVKEL